MDEIRRRDRVVFIRELFAGSRVFGFVVLTVLLAVFLQRGSPMPGWMALFGWSVFVVLLTASAWRASIPKRFMSQRFLLLWQSCTERHLRFKAALNQQSRRGIADLQELPRTIDGLLQEIYSALRRADVVANEVASSEGWLYGQPRLGQIASPDRQAQELYRIADKNIAEYRHHFQGVMASVERTEAQVAVFTTTLDTLRMKMLGYRLVGRDAAAPTHEFLAAITEARMQLSAIDKALDELELTPFPTMVAVVPDGDLRTNLQTTPEPPPLVEPRHEESEGSV